MLVAVVVTMLWAQKSDSRPQVELSFLGYTNLAGGPAVAFAAHFPPRFGGCSWSPTAVDSLEGGIWRLNSEKGPRSRQISSPPFVRATNGRRIDLILVFPIVNTNGTTRFRTRVDERPPAPPFLIALARDLWSRIRQASAPPQPPIILRVPPPPQSPLIDRIYWLTNEVRPSAPTGGQMITDETTAKVSRRE